jgi:hypothetical protein
MKKFTATFNAKNGFCHSIELKAENKKQATKLAQAYKRKNGYLGKTTIHQVKDPDKLKKAIINGLRKNGVSDEFIKSNFIFATI